MGDCSQDADKRNICTVADIQSEIFGKQPEVADFFKHHFAAYENANKFNNNLIVNIKFPLSTLNGNPASQGFSQMTDW